MQQSPLPGTPQAKTHSSQSGSAWASSAQMPSHAVSQQNGSMAQTAAQQSSSSQPGVPWSAQQSPLPGAPQVKVQAPSSQRGSAWASSVQMLSHSVSQQNGSMAHTALQQSASEQPVEPCATQQSPSAGHCAHAGAAQAIAAQIQTSVDRLKNMRLYLLTLPQV
jgi:hypothetical protein